MKERGEKKAWKGRERRGFRSCSIHERGKLISVARKIVVKSRNHARDGQEWGKFRVGGGNE